MSLFSAFPILRNFLYLILYPEVSLVEARERRDAFRRMIRDGLDPLDEKERAAEQQKREQAEQVALAQTFRKTAEEWFAVKTREQAEKTRKKYRQQLEAYLYPKIGDIPMTRLTPRILSEALKPLFDRVETCKRVAALARQVCQYAFSHGYVEMDAASVIMSGLPKNPPVQHRAAIRDPERLGQLLRDIDEYAARNISTLYCLKLLPYVFLRSGEIRNARWEEIHFDDALWVVPAERMKMHRAHKIPLARQVLGMLQELHDLTGHTGYLFPSSSSKSRALSDMAPLSALRRMGYEKDEMSVHGFRGTASTVLNELAFRKDVIEVQLSHGDPDKIRDAYNHAEYLPERRALMQAWADILDGLRDGKSLDEILAELKARGEGSREKIKTDS